MCNCIEETTKLIIERTGDPNAYIHCSYSFSNLEAKPSGLTACYREKKWDGTFKERESKIGIVPTYCPFCGKKYE